MDGSILLGVPKSRYGLPGESGSRRFCPCCARWNRGTAGPSGFTTACASAREALFLSEIEARAAELENVTVTLFDSEVGARIDADAIGTDLGGAFGEWSYYLCGPKPMVEAVSGGLRKRGVSRRSVHKEEFEFR